MALASRWSVARVYREGGAERAIVSLDWPDALGIGGVLGIAAFVVPLLSLWCSRESAKAANSSAKSSETSAVASREPVELQRVRWEESKTATLYVLHSWAGAWPNENPTIVFTVRNEGGAPAFDLRGTLESEIPWEARRHGTEIRPRKEIELRSIPSAGTHDNQSEPPWDAAMILAYLEIFIMCFELDEPRYILSMDPFANVLIDDDQDIQHAVHTFENCPTSQLTSIAEACFIRHFQPEYNRVLKNSFPTTTLRILTSYYELDFNAIVSEVNTEDIFSRLYSETVPPGFHHIVPFDLHSVEDRMSFFQISLDRQGNRTPILDA